MKIVAANFADTLFEPGSTGTVEDAALASMREELRGLFGEAEDDVPVALATLAARLDGVEPGFIHGA